MGVLPGGHMKYLIFIFGIIFLLQLPACNTMEGLGKDVQKIGEKIEKKAEN